MRNFLLTISSLLCLACSGTDPGATRAVVTEADVVGDPALRLQPGASVVVTHLEPADDTALVDVAGEGSDVFPFVYSRSAVETYCWEGDETAFHHSLSLQALNGETLLEVSANDGCVSADIPDGEILLSLTHDDADPFGHVLFLVPTTASTREVRIDECRDCDLSGGNFQGMNLHDTDFSGANLRGANLRDANLQGATLAGATLAGTQLSLSLTSQASIGETIPPPGVELDTTRLLSARIWDYAFNWIEGAYGSEPDTLTILSSEAGEPKTMAVFELTHSASEARNALTFTRMSGEVSAEQLEFALSDCTDAIPVTLTASDERHREYQFTLDGSLDDALCHHVEVSGFDVLQFDQVTVQYERNSEKPTRFTDFLGARLDRDDAFALERIGVETGAPRPLRAHLERFFDTLFFNEARAHSFRVSVSGLVTLVDGVREVPFVLAPMINSADLDDVIPELTAGIKDRFAAYQSPFDRLLVRVIVFDERQVAALTLSNATLTRSAISDL